MTLDADLEQTRQTIADLRKLVKNAADVFDTSCQYTDDCNWVSCPQTKWCAVCEAKKKMLAVMKETVKS